MALDTFIMTVVEPELLTMPSPPNSDTLDTVVAIDNLMHQFWESICWCNPTKVKTGGSFNVWQGCRVFTQKAGCIIWCTMRGGTRGEFGSWWKEPVWYNSGIGGKLEVGGSRYIISSMRRPVDNLIFNTNSQSYQPWLPWLLFLNQDQSCQVALNLARADNAGNQHYKAQALSGAWEISDKG